MEQKQYESKVIQWQERHQSYTSEGKYDLVTLCHEALIIFCIQTGEFKIVKHSNMGIFDDKNYEASTALKGLSDNNK